MHPAISVICFTLLSGAGYGLLTLLCLDSAFDLGFRLGNAQRNLLCVVSLVLITVGLVCSTFHLANPKNAWRAFFRFRTSWLSREGVFAILVYPATLLWLFLVWDAPAPIDGVARVVALLTGFLAMATLFSTGMIYACLKTIRQWNTALTPANYLFLGSMLGAWVLAVVASRNEVIGNAANVTLGLTLIAALSKITYFYWIGQPAGPTINSALGFTRATVRLLDVGHGGSTFLTDEFGYEVARVKLIWLRVACIVCAFLIPVALVFVLNRDSTIVTLAAALFAFTGTFIERWLFFAEARHVVNLYHGAPRT